MKVTIPIYLLIMSVLLLSGCGFGEKKSSQARHTGLVVVNVLDKELFDDCHIKGSINIPFETIEICKDIIDKNAEVVFYCSNYFCSASGQACKMLKKEGFSRVYAYEGGTAEWFQQGLPVEGPAQSSYLTKHIKPSDEHDPEISLISMNELALKMGILPAQ
jgi:rhodanese-related sulfurtransferase